MQREVQVAIDCADPDRLAAFWAEVLGYAVPAFGEPGSDWRVLVDRDGRRPSLLFHRVPEPKVVKNRVHIDVRLEPGASKEQARPLVDAEARRLVALGATHVRTTDDERDYYAVLQDPEGNEFCVG